MQSGVYMIQHTQSGRYYIGSAVNLRDRTNLHKQQLNKGTHPNPKLLHAWRKYGCSAFAFAMLECCVPEKLLEREQHWMDKLNPFYNICRIAGSRLGVKSSPETCRRISESNKGRHLSSETKEKMRKAKLGRKLSAEHKAKISISLLGNTRCRGISPSAETRQKMSRAHKGRIITWGDKISAAKKAARSKDVHVSKGA